MHLEDGIEQGWKCTWRLQWNLIDGGLGGDGSGGG